VPPGASVLDLCTGTGVQALQQADKADRIIAVDINPRAAAIARINAQLNGVPNVTVRVGDLYAPLRRGRLRERFDVIIANPPFVASPYAAAASYHSGGATGDRVLQRIVAGFDAHLSEGGRAFAITHLALRHGESVEAVSARWFKSFPGRAVILVLETGTAVDLAAAQSLFALERGLAAYGREVHRWVTYLRRHRIDRVTLLLMVAERDGHRALEVVDAQQRVLPIPLTRSPAERVREWLHAGNG
jgi:carbamoyltransferase